MMLSLEGNPRRETISLLEDQRADIASPWAGMHADMGDGEYNAMSVYLSVCLNVCMYVSLYEHLYSIVI